VRPVPEAITDLVDDLLPLARRLDRVAEPDPVPGPMRRGDGYRRRRAVAAANGGELVPLPDLPLSEMPDGSGR
jgi:carboxylate-amine ligase